MADDADDDAETPAADAETPAADATDGQKKPDQDKADDDDQDDLLSSPAFLKQKLKVLQAELEKVEADTAGLKDEAAALADVTRYHQYRACIAPWNLVAAVLEYSVLQHPR